MARKMLPHGKPKVAHSFTTADHRSPRPAARQWAAKVLTSGDSTAHVEEGVRASANGNGRSETEEQTQPLAKSQAVLAKTDPQLVGLATRLLEADDLIDRVIDHIHQLGVHHVHLFTGR